MRKVVMLLLALSVATHLFSPPSAWAFGDQDRARQAVEAGEIQPLKKILKRLGGKHRGRVLDAQLQQAGGNRWIYVIKMLNRDGNVSALVVDARSGEVLQVLGRD